MVEKGMGESQEGRGNSREVNLWKFRGEICDHGICIEDCDRCGRVPQKGEKNGSKADHEAGKRIPTDTRGKS